MPNDAEIMKRAINDFQRVQEHMEVAKSENALKTYSNLKKLCFFKSIVYKLRREPHGN